MKVRNVSGVFMLIVLCVSVGIAQNNSIKYVLPEKMNIGSLIFNYPCNTFDNNKQTKIWINSMIKQQPNGKVGILSNTKANLFLLEQKNDDNSVQITAYMVFWSNKLHTWQIDETYVFNQLPLNQGVFVFSRK